MTVAAVELWGTRIGAVALTGSTGIASFEYEPAFLASGIQLSPLRIATKMPVESQFITSKHPSMPSFL
jgi:serine/threonine-protein kinase HipA